MNRSAQTNRRTNNRDHAEVTQANLARFYAAHFLDPRTDPAVLNDNKWLSRMKADESGWLAEEDARVCTQALPANARSFMEWYRELRLRYDRMLSSTLDYFARRAPLAALAYYVFVEQQVDGRFDDTIAYAQAGLQGDAKLALSENFWDEMGCGSVTQMHTALFETSAAYMRDYLNAKGLHLPAQPPAEALKNGNLLLAYALDRRYHRRLLGAITVLEHTAPTRFRAVTAGLERLGVPEDVIYYHRLHIGVDEGHGDDLLNRVLMPIIEECPAAARDFALGAAVRFNVSRDYYGRIEQDLRRLGFWRG